MPSYKAPVEDVMFLLGDVFDLSRYHNLPGFEEAARALFAGEPEAFRARIARWPRDVREHAERLALGAATASLP